MKKSLFAFLILFSLVFISCEVGLGKSPDLEAPEISITSMESGGTIVKGSEFGSAIYCKREVLFKGKATDNEKVKSVDIEIKWDGQNDYSHFAKADLHGKDWSVNLLFETEGVASLKFTVSDEAKNISTKSSQVVTLFIDDTAPIGNAWYIDRKVNGIQYSLRSLEYLKGLNLDDAENKDAAQNVQFSIRGSFNDTMGIKNVFIELFDEGGNKLCKINKTSESGLYAPEFYVSESELSAINDNKLHYVEVRYSAEDVVTVPESNKVDQVQIPSGWFIWWPESDNPRIVPSTAPSEEDGEIHLNIKTTLSLTIFDDDSLKEAYCALLTNTEYNTISSSWKDNPVSITAATTNNDRKGSFTIDSNNSAREVVKSLKAPDSPDTTMHLVAYALDGTENEVETFIDISVQVTDESDPKLFIKSPKNNSIPVLELKNNDTKAEFTIEGQTLDTTGCSYLEFVWVPDSITDKYSAAEKWLKNIITDDDHQALAGASGEAGEDGMKLWAVALEDKGFKNGFRQHEFSFTVDLFNDFKNGATNEQDKDKYFLAKLTRMDGKFIYTEYKLKKDDKPPTIKPQHPTIDMQTISDNEDYTLSFYAEKDSKLPIDKSKYKITTKVGKAPSNPEMNGNYFEATISKSDLMDMASSGTKPKYEFSATDIFGNSSSEVFTLVISDLPTLTGFSSTSPTECKKGEEIDITATFSKSVGILDSELDNLKLRIKGIKNSDKSIGVNDPVLADYSSGNGTPTLHFTYTVQEGDVSDGLTLDIDENNENKQYPIVTEGITSLAANKVEIKKVSEVSNTFAGIKVDGKSPKIRSGGIVFSSIDTDDQNKYKGITYLKEGKTLQVVVTTDEKVTVQGNPKFKLSNDIELPFTEITDVEDVTDGTVRSMLTFKKKITNTDSDGQVKHKPEECINGYSVIKDSYGNSLLLVAGEEVKEKFYIDRTPPEPPVIENADGNALSETTKYNSVTIQIKETTNGEAVRQFKYSENGGSSWKDYDDSNKPTLTSSCSLTSQSIDYAGNASDPADVIELDISDTFPNYTVEFLDADGYYTAGDEITIKVVFDAPVNIETNSGAKIYLSKLYDYETVSSGAYAAIKSESEKDNVTSAEFTYTVTKNDQFTLQIDSGKEDGVGVHLGNKVKDLYGCTDGRGLSSDYGAERSVVCDGKIPFIKKMTPGSEKETGSNIYQNGNEITIEFNEPVQKGTGKIILRQVKQWAIPPVISGPDFNTILSSIPADYKIGNLTGSQILYMDGAEDVQDLHSGIKHDNDYYHGTGQFIGPYKKSSYGITDEGAPDTITKYVLDVNMGIWETTEAHYYGTTFDPAGNSATPVTLNDNNSTTITANNIREVLEKAGYHQRELDVTAAAVETTDNRIYTIKFPKGITGDETLPDGREWELVIDKGAFLDYTGKEFGSKYTSDSTTVYTTEKTATDSIMQNGGTLTDTLGAWATSGRGRTSVTSPNTPVVLVQTSNSKNSFWSDKVATPVIRIDRYSYGVGIKQSDSTGLTTNAITANDTAAVSKPTGYVRVRIDCETDGAVITYGKSITSNSRDDTANTDANYNSAEDPKELESSNAHCYSYITSTAAPTILETMTLENTYTINDFFAAGNGDYTKSCKDYIVARGTKTLNGHSFTASARGKECAFQTVVRFYRPFGNRNENSVTYSAGLATGHTDFSIRGTTGWGGEPAIVPYPLRDSRPGSCYLRRCYRKYNVVENNDAASEYDYYWVSYEILVKSSFSGYSWHNGGYYDWCQNWGYMHPGEFTICVNMKNWG